MSDPRSESAFDAAAPGFSVRKALELDSQGLVARIGFTALYGLISLLVVPWPVIAGWLAAVVGWEAFTQAFVNRALLKLPERRAIDLFVACNIVGALAYTGDAVVALGTGTPIGIAIGATWLAG